VLSNADEIVSGKTYIYYNMYKCFGYKGHEWRPKMFLKYSIECSFHFQILFTLGCKHKFYNGRKLNKLKKVSQIYFCINQVVSTIFVFWFFYKKCSFWFYLCCDLDLNAKFFLFYFIWLSIDSIFVEVLTRTMVLWL